MLTNYINIFYNINESYINLKELKQTCINSDDFSPKM